MYRSKVVKKKTRNRQTLLRNLNKGKARKEPSCGYEVIPYSNKYPYKTHVHLLYGDVPLLEVNNSLTLEASLYNSYKLYKQSQIIEYPNQKVVKIQVENRKPPEIDWKPIVDKISNAESLQLREWAKLITTYCERYESVIKQLKEDEQFISEERLQSLIDINAKTEKIKDNIHKNYPFLEFKSQMKDGYIQLTEVAFSERYLQLLGYDVDSFPSIVFQEGIPEMVPTDSLSASAIAKFRLLKYLTTDPDGYQTPEFESVTIMKGGYIKKIRMRVHYLTCYEKGVIGYTFIAVIVAKQKPVLPAPTISEPGAISQEFVKEMSQKEKEMSEFLAAYYSDEKVDEKYTNLHKVCQIKEIPVGDNEKLEKSEKSEKHEKPEQHEKHEKPEKVVKVENSE